jgi:enhancing lycopene biosynthesis protein 2
MKKFALVFCGCGFKDGTAITEAVSTMIALGASGANHSCFALNKDFTSLNHLTDENLETRNTLTESARIARGNIEDIKTLYENDFDGLIFPGGFGVVKHMCEWLNKGSRGQVEPEVKRVILDFYEAEKPIGALCIAPVLLAQVLGEHEITLTIGNDQETAREIEKTGAVHEDCPVEDFVTDRAHRIVTTPAYMYSEATPYQVSQGIHGLVREMVEMA